MQLSEHFSLEELTSSDTAARFDIDNTLPDSLTTNVTELALGLEEVRKLLGFPMHINSGYRCPELNAKIGGAKNSAHTLAHAADFICPQFGTPLEICNAIAAAHIDFDQVITEGTWVHISFAQPLRGQLLTAHFGEGGTTYTAGL